MIEEVSPQIFRMEIPLPANPLRSINSYLLKGKDRFLMIDTGMNREECMEAMESCLKELQVDLGRTDFFITHLHADHLGLVSELVTDSSTIFFNQPDLEVIQDRNHWQEMSAFAGRNGFPEEDLQAAIKRHPGYRYHFRGPLDFKLLQDGSEVAIGEYSLRCVQTPGHTRGHLCLYEPRKKIFFSGDHLLNTITPNISLFSDNHDPLKEYLESLDKTRDYDIDLVLPGHRGTFLNHRRRIEELKHHHAVRNDEVLSILAGGALNAYQVASRMTWDIDCEEWEDFPLPQKWFAAGEALAHLQYLVGTGRVKRETQEGRILFALRNE